MPTQKGTTKTRKNVNAYKKLSFSEVAAQEVEVHTSLPPCVVGEQRGILKVLIQAVRWEYSIGPPAPKLCLRLKWWGEQSRGTIFRVPVYAGPEEYPPSGGRFAIFPIRTTVQQLRTYLKDMGSLSIDVGLGHLSDSSMVIGQVTVPVLSRLSVDIPIEGHYSVMSPQGTEFGKVMMRFSLEEKVLPMQIKAPPTEAEHQLQFDPQPDPLPEGTFTNVSRQPVNLGLEAESVSKRNKSSTASMESGKTTVVTSRRKCLELSSDIENVPPVDGGPLPGLSGKARGDVIEDLILRGRKLRESMLQAVVQASLAGSSPPQYIPSMPDESRELESCALFGQPSNIPRRLSGLPTDDLVALMAGGGPSTDVGHASVGSSDSDNESVDIEADHDVGLLGDLLYVAQLKDTEEVDGASQTNDGRHPPSMDGAQTTKDVVNQVEMAVGNSAVQTRKDKTSQHNENVTTVDSISSLASFFTTNHKSAEIAEPVLLQSIGMEKLTRLGRVTSVRVIVDKLQLEPIGIEIVKSFQKDKKLLRAPSITYFVEYHFPLTLLSNKNSNGKSACSSLRSGELVRMASRQAKGGGVVFSHCSVFPVVFSSQVVQQWWETTVVLRVYSKSSEERMPFLLGKATLPLKQCLTASQLKSRFVLDIKASPQTINTKRHGHFTSAEEPIIGKLEISFQFIIGKQQQRNLLAEEEEEEEEQLIIDPIVQKIEQEQGEGPTGPRDFTIKLPTVLQLMLYIPEGVNISMPNSSSKPNPYLICKLFCVSLDPRSAVHWTTSNPLFGFKEVYPVPWTLSLLEKLCNKFIVIEVWNKTLGNTADDELIGLVKLSVHQFYVAFVDKPSMDLCLSAELPVVAVDAYSPIINPFSGAHCGDLAVLMAMGKISQLLQLQRQLAAGTYVLQPPHSMSRMEQQPQPQPSDGGCQADQRAPDLQTVPSPESSRSPNAGLVLHTIEICVEGVRQLSAFSNTVWGEADCYVQYHFPVLSNQDQEEEAVFTLQPHCTEMSLCVPEPTFNHTTKHILTLSTYFPLQKVLIKTCNSNDGVPFELWRRFYYPNTRDQLIAKTSLPLAKLCAMVTMQRAMPNAQSFALPLKLVIEDPEATSGGILDVFVKYHSSCKSDESTEQHKRSSVNLSLGILRCTGLKDAAKQADLLSSSPLSFASEAGVNAYVKVRLPELLMQEERRTKTIALSFTPEFSYFFDICLPLSFQEGVKPHSVQIRKVSLAERLSSVTMCIEVWHEVQRRQTRGPLSDDKPFGRMLVTGSKDVLLGCAELPLANLLYRQNGLCGWFAIYSKGDAASGTATRYIGAVELSLSFTREEDRELVVSHAACMGWKSNSIAESFVGSSADTQKKLVFEVTIDNVWVSVDEIAIPLSGQPSYKYCYVRYKFFTLDPVVSALRSVASCVEGTADYQLNHLSKLSVLSSAQLHWYLMEEFLEIQVWTSLVSKNEESRPQASDKLQGCAYIPLQDLASQCNDTPVVSGSFPLFKSGVDNLNNQHLHFTIRKTVLEDLKDVPVIEIMDKYSETETLDPLTTFEKERETALQVEMPQPLMDMFEVRLAVCEALHLQDVTSHERSFYVTVQPHPTMENIVTPLVQDNGKPVWDFQCVTRLPNYYLDSECSGLEFQVWSTHCQSAEGWTREDDVYLGSAHVDLSTLAYGLGQLCGWYHIMDLGQQIRGQLKVGISPTQRIKFASSLQSRPNYQSQSMNDCFGVRETYHTVTEPQNFMPSDSRTTSFLFQELRQNIAELDKVIQARLEDRDSTQFSSSTTSYTCSSIPPLRTMSAISSKYSTEAVPFRSATDPPDHHCTRMDNAQDEQDLLNYQKQRQGHTSCLRNRCTCIPPHSSEENAYILCPLGQQKQASHPAEVQRHDSHPSNRQEDDSHPSEEQRHDFFLSEGQRHDSHPSEEQRHDPHPSEGQRHDPHPSEGQRHDPHPPEGQRHDPHPSEGQRHDSQQGQKHTTSTSFSSNAPVHNVAPNTSVYSSASVSPEHHELADQESTSCCSTPVKSQLDSSLTSVTRSSCSESLDGEDVEEQVSTGKEDSRHTGGTEQVQIEVPMANNDHVSGNGANGCCPNNVPTVTESSPHVFTSAGTHATCTISFAAPLQTGDALTGTNQKPAKGTSCNTVPTIDLPDFFMSPYELEQTMRSLRAAALSRPPPRTVVPVGKDTPSEKKPSESLNPHKLTKTVDLSSAEMQRIAKVFSSKPKGPLT